MSDRETLADRLYKAVVQPELTWWDDLTPEMQESWLRAADVARAEAASFDGLDAYIERLRAKVEAMTYSEGAPGDGSAEHYFESEGFDWCKQRVLRLLAALREGETP